MSACAHRPPNNHTLNLNFIVSTSQMIWNRTSNDLSEIKKQNKNEEKRGNMAPFMEYKIWFKLRCWSHQGLIFSLETGRTDFDFHWAHSIGKEADFNETAGLNLPLQLCFSCFRIQTFRDGIKDFSQIVHIRAVIICKGTNLLGEIIPNDFFFFSIKGNRRWSKIGNEDCGGRNCLKSRPKL